MQPKSDTFSIRLYSSRLAKGLLAVPRKFTNRFPQTQCQIQIIFDDEEKVLRKTFLPYDPKVKEARIFGLSTWFAKRGMKPGDLITVTIEDKNEHVYRLALDRYIQERREQRARQRLWSAQSDAAAKAHLIDLARITKRRPRDAAVQEVLQIAQKSASRSRSRSPTPQSGRLEPVPSAIRVLLGEVHAGKCQICSFTFEKKDREPYFEIHHIDPLSGHHPTNLLLLCANCHAQFEHATVADYERVAGWLTAVRINGKRRTVRQPFIRKPLLAVTAVLLTLGIALRAGLGLR